MNRHRVLAVLAVLLTVTASLAGGIATAQQSTADLNTTNVSDALHTSDVSVQQTAPDSRPGSGQLVETFDAGESGTIGNLSERYSRYGGYVYVEAHGAPGQDGEDGDGYEDSDDPGGAGGSGGYIEGWLTNGAFTSQGASYQAGAIGGGEAGTSGEGSSYPAGDGGDGGGSSYFDVSNDGSPEIEAAGGGGGTGGWADGPSGFSSCGGSGGDGEGLNANGGAGAQNSCHEVISGGDGGTFADGFSYTNTGTSSESTGVVRVYAPQVHDPGVSGVSYNDGTLTVDIQDGDLGYAWGDEFNVSVYRSSNDELLGEKTFTGDSPTFDASIEGEEDVYVEIEDLAGNAVTSDDITVYGTGTVSVVDEATLNPINDTTVTIEAYPADGDGEIVEYQASNGQVNLSGLDPTTEYTLSASANGYHARTIIVESVAEQQSIYMLPDDGSVNTVDVQFQLEDYSGQYDSSTSRLLIQRPIEQNGERRLRTVAADTFGAGNQYTATLEQDQRYVLIVENEEGIERPQGDFVAREPGATVIEVGTITWTAEEAGYSWRAEYQNATNGAIVTYGYSDLTEQTSELQVTVHERTDRSNVLTTRTFDGPLGNASFTANVPADQRNVTWEVTWTATRNGEEIEGSRVVSGRLGEVANPFDGPWGIIVVGMLLTFVSLIFGGSYAATGTVVVAGFASLLWWIGWLPVSGLVMLGVLIIAALYAGGDRV